MTSQWLPASFEGPPFRDTADPFLSVLLKRYYYDASTQRYVWVNDHGRMVPLESLARALTPLTKSRVGRKAKLKAFAALANHIDQEHRIRMGPWEKAFGKFWILGDASNPAYCLSGADFSHLL